MSHHTSNIRTVCLLIVEDEDEDFVLARECLSAAPNMAFSVLRAQALAEAVAILGARPVDLVLLDLSLPDSVGWDTFARLQEASSDLPVIVLTGSDDQDVATRAIGAGAQDYIPKAQMTTETLARAVRYAMERHKAEKALREYRDHLEQLVASRSRDLQDSNQKLQAANMHLSKTLEELKSRERQLLRYERVSALGQMAGGVMNDFNNLLMPVIGYSEMLLDTPDMFSNRELALEMVRHIRSAAMNAAGIVRRLRRFYQAGDDEERRSLDINLLVQRVIDDTRSRWRETMAIRGVRIRVDTDFDPVAPVRGSESQLTEALTNVVLNAFDAMQDGGILTVRTVAAGEYVTVEICDTGTGMPEQTRQRCFDPFFTTKGASAVGLGLSVTQGIICGHGGEIEVASWEGQGTRVTLNLPAEAAIPPAARSEPSAPPPRELHILVVDDDIEVCRLLKTYFTRISYEVDTAETAEEGIERLRGATFDVVITDQALPDRSGEEGARFAKTIRPATSVIMLTGFADLLKSRASFPEGVDRIVGKPVPLSELDRIVRDVKSRPSPATPPAELLA